MSTMWSGPGTELLYLLAIAAGVVGLVGCGGNDGAVDMPQPLGHITGITYDAASGDPTASPR